jgi:hypothetical protein
MHQALQTSMAEACLFASPHGSTVARCRHPTTILRPARVEREMGLMFVAFAGPGADARRVAARPCHGKVGGVSTTSPM